MSYFHPGADVLARIVLLTLLLLTTQAGFSADEMPQNREIEHLNQQVRELQQRVERLEGEIAQGVPVNRAREVEPVPGGWRKSHNWQLLTEGMAGYRVREILGEPDREKTVKKFEFWYYGDGKVKMYLRRLSSWEIPRGIDTE